MHTFQFFYGSAETKPEHIYANMKLYTECPRHNQMVYEDIFGDHLKLKKIISPFTKVLDIRKTIQEENTDPSNLDGMLMTSYNLHDCILNYSSGT